LISSSWDSSLGSASGRRFVQLPTDVKRSSAVDYQPACPAVVRLPVAASDVLNDHPYEPGEDLHLGSWDVHVLVEI